MTGIWGPGVKFGVFAVVMAVFTAALVVVFSQYQSGSVTTHSALFTDSSGLKPGETVRVAGIRVGTVREVALRADHTVRVTFEADNRLPLTSGTRASIRYLNLVGDRYLELLDGPGPMAPLAPGAEIPVERTAPALDLDLLLGGFKPVISALDPRDVNALTSSLLQIMQGEGGTMASLLSNTSSFATGLADHSQTIQQLIDRLRDVMTTLSTQGDDFASVVDRLEGLVAELSTERDPIGAAVDALDAGTASMADLLTQSRAPLNGTIDQLARLAPMLDTDKERIDSALQRGPENMRKLARLGSYGSFFQFYLCAINVKVTGFSGQTVTLPWIRQSTGRCAP